jgi:sulfur relay (sulfurtransferase) complex TusBCD TusD component (DsrE family)
MLTIIEYSPYHIKHLKAYKYVRDFLKKSKYHDIVIYFYDDGVYIANGYIPTIHFEYNIQSDWINLHYEYNVSLYVCSSSCISRGILDLNGSTINNLNNKFIIGNISLLSELISSHNIIKKF